MREGPWIEITMGDVVGVLGILNEMMHPRSFQPVEEIQLENDGEMYRYAVCRTRNLRGLHTALAEIAMDDDLNVHVRTAAFNAEFLTPQAFA